jgi:hypothetical protein
MAAAASVFERAGAGGFQARSGDPHHPFDPLDPRSRQLSPGAPKLPVSLLATGYSLPPTCSCPSHVPRPTSTPHRFFRETSVFSNAGRKGSYFDPGLHSTHPS